MMTSDQKLKLAAISLGYREHPHQPNKWLKPFGANIFIIYLFEKVIDNHFYGADRELRCWASNEIEISDSHSYDDVSLMISDYEVEMYHAFLRYTLHPFGFVTSSDIASVAIGEL